MTKTLVKQSFSWILSRTTSNNFFFFHQNINIQNACYCPNLPNNTHFVCYLGINLKKTTDTSHILFTFLKKEDFISF